MLVTIPQFPDQKVLVALFAEVQNAEEIKKLLVDQDLEFDYSFIDASVVVSVEQLLSAVYKTLLDVRNETMKSKNTNSELIFNLSPFNGISDSFSKIGIASSSKNLILVKFEPSDDELDHLKSIVKGDYVDINDDFLNNNCDLKKIKKMFKLNQCDDTEKLSRLIIGITQLK